MTPQTLMPAAGFIGGLCCLFAAFPLGYMAARSQGLRSAFYGALSLGSTLAGAACIFGNLIAAFITR